MSDVLLTYIVPVFNTGGYVQRCLESIVGQEHEPSQFEVLVVDDGSTDGSRSVVEDFAQSHPQVRLLCQENAGVSAARNTALDAARGRYVQFVDSDDYLQVGVMPALLEQAVANSLDVLVFNYNRIEIGGSVTPKQTVDSTPVMTGVRFLEKNAMTPYIWRYLINRDYLEHNAWRFDTSLIACEDGELIARFMLPAQRVAGNGTLAYCYVCRQDSAMHSQDQEHLLNRIFSQVDAAVSIDKTIDGYQRETGLAAPASASGLRNVYLYFSMTNALTSGHVRETIDRIKRAGLYPFPCVGPEADYHGVKWKVIHRLMMHPRLWTLLSNVYAKIK